MVKYCAVAICRNGSKKRPDLSYFSFPQSRKVRKKWEVFCKRADKKFNTLSDPRICSLPFKETDVEIFISGRKKVHSGCSPTIFDPSISKTNSTRADRLDIRKRKCVAEQPQAKKVCAHKFAYVTAFHHDHSYLCAQEEATPRNNMVVELPKGKLCCVAFQTDLTADEIDYLASELEECRRQYKILSEKLENKKELKRELTAEDMLKDDESVRFYTGFPNLACFHLTLELIQPYTKNIKYWDKKKEGKSYY
ncbi:uncharacterized protein LOC122951610 [Acropora millepora]|uniref:uncharacterized protein LOC122951610 n=1 Tax=Acropora millepora TaxID=45264 RepID=UPI001CF512F3|nr:uncharacterized protein LOC122951610 [Acropora millepora]